MADYERRARQQQSVSNVWFIKKAVTRVHKIELCALHAYIILYWARARHSFGRCRRRRRRNFRMQRKRHERTNERESPILLETNRPTDRPLLVFNQIWSLPAAAAAATPARYRPRKKKKKTKKHETRYGSSSSSKPSASMSNWTNHDSLKKNKKTHLYRL